MHRRSLIGPTQKTTQASSRSAYQADAGIGCLLSISKFMIGSAISDNF
jgi:hypothetical protein